MAIEGENTPFCDTIFSIPYFCGEIILKVILKTELSLLTVLLKYSNYHFKVCPPSLDGYMYVDINGIQRGIKLKFFLVVVCIYT